MVLNVWENCLKRQHALGYLTAAEISGLSNVIRDVFLSVKNTECLEIVSRKHKNGHENISHLLIDCILVDRLIYFQLAENAAGISIFPKSKCCQFFKAFLNFTGFIKNPKTRE